MSLRERLQSYFMRHHTTWIPSGELQRMVSEKTSYTPSNVSRRCRELENAGVLEVKMVKGHAHYRLKDHEKAFAEF